MEFQVKYEWTDYLHALLLHMQRTGWSKVAQYAGYEVMGLMLILSLWAMLFSGIQVGFLIPIILLIAAFIILYRFVFLPRQARKIFTQSKELNLPITFEITDSGLKSVNELGSTLRLWENFHKWKEDDEMMMLYLSDIAFIMLPKRFIKDSQRVELIKSHLAQKGVLIARYKYGWNLFVVVFLLFFFAWVVYFYLALAGR